MPAARLVHPFRISAGHPELRGVTTANFDSESEPLLNREGAIVYKKTGGFGVYSMNKTGGRKTVLITRAYAAN
jgi:hypothetical protein